MEFITRISTLKRPQNFVSTAIKTTPTPQLSAVTPPTPLVSQRPRNQMIIIRNAETAAAFRQWHASQPPCDTLFVVVAPELTRKSPKEYLISFRKWADPEYRHAYAKSAVEHSIAWQIRINREHRELSQAKLAKHIGTKQSAVSRAEDACYGKYNVNTLAKIANAFDCALEVRFIPYSKLAKRNEDLSATSMIVKSYEEEVSS